MEVAIRSDQYLPDDLDNDYNFDGDSMETREIEHSTYSS